MVKKEDIHRIVICSDVTVGKQKYVKTATVPLIQVQFAGMWPQTELHVACLTVADKVDRICFIDKLFSFLRFLLYTLTISL